LRFAEGFFMNLLIEVATRSLEKAYNPYSGLSVGCALETTSGKIYD